MLCDHRKASGIRVRCPSENSCRSLKKSDNCRSVKTALIDLQRLKRFWKLKRPSLKSRIVFTVGDRPVAAVHHRMAPI